MGGANNSLDSQTSLLFLSAGTNDPSVVPTIGLKGNIYIRYSGRNPNPVGLYQKQDDGLTTNWNHVGSGIGGSGAEYFSFRKNDDGGTHGYVPYYSSPSGMNWSVFSWAANVIRSMPFPCPIAKTIMSVGVNVTTAVALGKVRLSIYEDSGNLYPQTLIADFGEIDASTTGFKEITGLNITLQAGKLYWLTLVTNASIGLSVVTPSGGIPNILGHSVLTQAGISNYTCNMAYGPFPSVYPWSSGGTLTGGGTPLILVKFSS